MNSKEEVLFRCEKCSSLYRDKVVADQCCKQRYCKCGKEIPHYNILCDTCAEKIKFNNAKKITLDEYDGDFVYDCMSEQYFPDIDALYEYYDTEEGEPPTYVYACNPSKFELDIDNALEHATDDHYEGIMDDLVDVDELIKFVEEWNKKQTATSYCDDAKTIIVLGE